jgi:sortase (surface protein transpeptidase)
VDAPVSGLSLEPDGHLQTPPISDRNLVGWFKDGVTPGEAGNTILAGHVDTLDGPAVFWSLGALHSGDHLNVLRTTGRVAVFTVYAINLYPKIAFPDSVVYGPTSRPEMRIITCGGKYSKRNGYQDNLVVYAFLTGELDG